MTDYVLVGGGAFAREILGWFEPDLPAGDRFAGYIDDGDGPMAKAGYDLPHLGPIVGFKPGPEQQLVMALTGPADNRRRRHPAVHRVPPLRLEPGGAERGQRLCDGRLERQRDDVGARRHHVGDAYIVQAEHVL